MQSIKGLFTGLRYQRVKPPLFEVASQTVEGIVATETLQIVFRGPLTCTVGKELHCVGYWDNTNKVRVWCREKKVGIRKCPECLSHELDRMLARGAIRKELAEIDHVVYLAFFGTINGQDVIKVGVASKGRVLTRLAEQGARYALIIAHANGVTVRKLEKIIHKQGGIPHRISAKQKMVTSIQVMKPEYAAPALFSVAYNVRQYVAEYYTPDELVISIDASCVYNLPGNLVSIEKQPIIANCRVSGILTGWVGQNLFLKQNDTTRLIYAPNLVGYPVKIDRRFVPNSEAVNQISLF